MSRNSVLEELSVRRFAVIQEEIRSRALWRWSMLESKWVGRKKRAECHLRRGDGLGNKRKWGYWEEWYTWRRVVDQGQSLEGHRRRMCTRRTGRFHIWHPFSFTTLKNWQFYVRFHTAYRTSALSTARCAARVFQSPRPGAESSMRTPSWRTSQSRSRSTCSLSSIMYCSSPAVVISSICWQDLLFWWCNVATESLGVSCKHYRNTRFTMPPSRLCPAAIPRVSIVTLRRQCNVTESSKRAADLYSACSRAALKTYLHFSSFNWLTSLFCLYRDQWLRKVTLE